MPDVNHNRILHGVGRLFAPYAFVNLLRRKNLAGILHEQGYDFIFRGSQLDVLALHNHDFLFSVQYQTSVDHCVFICFG